MKSTGRSATPSHALYASELNRDLNQRASAANAEQSSVERRQHPRNGAVQTLEDITYRVLRRYDVVGEPA